MGLGVVSGMCVAQGVNCGMQDYKAIEGLRATASAGGVTLAWQGEEQQELRAQFAMHDGKPVVVELAARKAAGAWVELAKDLDTRLPDPRPSGGCPRPRKTSWFGWSKDTPENEEIYKWNVFWDAPLAVPGYDTSHLVGAARTEAEIKRAHSREGASTNPTPAA